MAKSIEETALPIISAYCDVMEEIKVRTAAITALVEKPHEPIPAQILYESCYLQLRMICELIALACLIAHEDIEATKKKRIKRAYAADFIINSLESLHPRFYPRPSKQVRSDTGQLAIEDIKSGYLTKSDVLKLYTKCGNLLHRGSISNMARRLDPSKVSYVEIQDWLIKIVTLLNHHQIALYSYPDYEFWVIMEADHDGNPYGHLMKTIARAKKRI